MGDDQDKAIGEVAKATGKAVDAARELGQFVARYVHGSLAEGMGIVEDKLKYLRWERQIRLIDRANEKLLERGLSFPSRVVPLNIAIPLLQGGSMEESDFLQDQWATLLVNAADATAPTVRRAYISILEDLAPMDAEILDGLFDADATAPSREDGDPTYIYTYLLPERLSLDDPPKGERQSIAPEIETALVNLGRLGLICSAMAFGGMAAMACVHMTELGRQFVMTCRDPQVRR